MNKQANSKTHLRGLNQRQRKKLCVGEFQEMGFQVQITFAPPLDDANYEALLSDFIDFAAAKSLAFGGMGGPLPLAETFCVVHKAERGSCTEEDRQAIAAWLSARSEVASANAGELLDVWHSAVYSTMNRRCGMARSANRP